MGVARKAALGMALVASIALGSATAAFAGGISDDVARIGVLTDMSGQFLHESGEGRGHGRHETTSIGLPSTVPRKSSIAAFCAAVGVIADVTQASFEDRV